MRSLPGIPKQTVDRHQWVPVYTTAVSALGPVIIILALRNPPADLLGLALFFCMAFLSDILSVELFVTSRNSRTSITEAIGIAAIVAFGPTAGVLTLMGSGIGTGLASLRSKGHASDRAKWWRRVLFNTGMMVTSAWVAGMAYVALGGQWGSNRGLALNIIPLLGAAGSFYVTNEVILTGVLGLQTGRSPWRIWTANFRWAAPIAVLTSVVGGGILAFAFLQLGNLGALIFVLPILATGYAFRLYTDNMRVYVDGLEAANRQLEVANKNLDQANVGLLDTLGSVIDAYDMFTYAHSRHVAEYAEAIAGQLGLSTDGQQQIYKAALIHDVGKIGVADSIIGKQGPLTDEEYRKVKLHPLMGAEIVDQMKLEALQGLAPLVKYHHERWDGKGYPEGLAGERIPLGARILALADALDAMASHRPSRDALSFAEIKAELQRCAGKQFDPQVVSACLVLLEARGASFIKNSATDLDQNTAGGLVTRYMKKSQSPRQVR